MDKKFFHISIAGVSTIICSAVIIGAYFFWLTSHGSFDILGFVGSFGCLAIFLGAIFRALPLLEREWGLKESFVRIESKIFVYILSALWILMINGIFIVWAISEGGLENIWYNTIDANNYAEIAQYWYHEVEGSDLIYKIVFFPLYPIFMRFVQFFVRSMPVAGMIVSSVFAWLSGVMLYKLCFLEKSSHKYAANAVKFLLIFPSAFFFAVPMTESLYLFLSISFFYYVVKRNFFTAGAFCFFAALTRSQGLLMIIPFIIELIADVRKNGGLVKKGIFVLGAPLGFAVYLLINYQIYGDFFQFLVYQKENWSSGISWFFNTIDYLGKYLAGYIESGHITLVLGLSIPNIAVFWGSLSIIFAGAKKMRVSVTAYSLAYFFMSFGHSWLLSGPRYASVLFPMAMIAATFTSERKLLNFVWTIFYLILYIFYLYFFIARYYVL